MLVVLLAGAAEADAACTLAPAMTQTGPRNDFWRLETNVVLASAPRQLVTNTNPGEEICQIRLSAFNNTGNTGGTLFVQLYANAGGTLGAAIGPPSDLVPVTSLPTSAGVDPVQAFAWSGTKPAPTGDYWILVHDGGTLTGGTASCGAGVLCVRVNVNSDGGSYAGGSFYHNTSDTGEDAWFEVYLGSGGATPTPTVTATATATPTSTAPTATPTATRTATPTATPTVTGVTPTRTATPTPSPTKTPTPTVTATSVAPFYYIGGFAGSAPLNEPGCGTGKGTTTGNRPCADVAYWNARRRTVLTPGATVRIAPATYQPAGVCRDNTTGAATATTCIAAGNGACAANQYCDGAWGCILLDQYAKGVTFEGRTQADGVLDDYSSVILDLVNGATQTGGVQSANPCEQRGINNGIFGRTQDISGATVRDLQVRRARLSGVALTAGQSFTQRAITLDRIRVTESANGGGGYAGDISNSYVTDADCVNSGRRLADVTILDSSFDNNHGFPGGFNFGCTLHPVVRRSQFVNNCDHADCYATCTNEDVPGCNDRDGLGFAGALHPEVADLVIAYNGEDGLDFGGHPIGKTHHGTAERIVSYDNPGGNIKFSGASYMNLFASYAWGRGSGLGMYSCAHHERVWGNTFLNGIFMWCYATHWDVRNNIIRCNTSGACWTFDRASTNATHTIDYNVIVNEGSGAAVAQQAGSQVNDSSDNDIDCMGDQKANDCALAYDGPPVPCPTPIKAPDTYADTPTGRANFVTAAWTGLTNFVHDTWGSVPLFVNGASPSAANLHLQSGDTVAKDTGVTLAVVDGVCGTLAPGYCAEGTRGKICASDSDCDLWLTDFDQQPHVNARGADQQGATPTPGGGATATRSPTPTPTQTAVPTATATVAGLRCPSGASGCGPLVQNPLNDPTTMSVLWWTDQPGDARVEYGTTAALGFAATQAEQATCPLGAPGTCHRVDLPDLLPGTRYYYRLLTNGVVVLDVDGTRTFRTLRAAADTTQTTFAVVGGLGADGAASPCYAGGTCPNQRIAAQVAASQPDLLFWLGDQATVGLPTRLQDWEEKVLVPYAETLARAPVFAAIGDEDLRRADGTQAGNLTEWTLAHPQRALFAAPVNGNPGGTREEAWYGLDTSVASFLIVNTNFGPTGAQDWTSGANQKAWLWDRLQPGASRLWPLALGHHAPYVCVNGRCAGGANGGNGCAADAECPGSTCTATTAASSLPTRQRIVPLLEAGGVPVAFWGHARLFERSRALDDFASASATSDPATNSPNQDGQRTRHVTVGAGGAGLDGGARVVGGQPVDPAGAVCAPGGSDLQPYLAVGCGAYSPTGYCSTGVAPAFLRCTLADPTLTCQALDATGTIFDAFIVTRAVATPTPTRTATPTPSVTVTPTALPGQTATRTATPTPTATPTLALTATPTALPSPSGVAFDCLTWYRVTHSRRIVPAAGAVITYRRRPDQAAYPPLIANPLGRTCFPIDACRAVDLEARDVDGSRLVLPQRWLPAGSCP